MELLRAEGLTKDYGGVRAVIMFPSLLNPENIWQLSVPNGAGKTTLYGSTY